MKWPVVRVSWLKLSLAILVAIGTIDSLYALTYNNPGSGGVSDGYLRKNERAVDGYIGEGGSTNSANAGANLDSLFVTWDQNNLYIVLTTNNTASWDVAYGIAIDNTGLSNGYTGGSAPSDAWNRKIGFDSGWNIEYEIYFYWSSSDNAITSANLCSWDGSSWSCDALSQGTDYEYQGGSNGLQSLEVKIPLSTLGNPSNIAVSAWVAGADTGSSAVDAIPCEDDVADNNWTDDDYISEMYSHNVSSGRTPNYFIILDGTLMREGYQTDELFYTTSDKQAYVTWDADSIYIGYIFQDFSGDIDFCIYFDTDPQKTKNFGKGINIDSTVTITLPFNADYGIYVKDGSTPIDWLTFDGINWVKNTFSGNSYIGWSGNGTTELSIPWSELGNPDTLYMVIYSYNTTDHKAYGIAPSSNTDGSQVINDFIGIFRNTDNYSPADHINDANHIMEIYSSAESGDGTLRDAISTANTDPAQDTILFMTDATITLTSNFPKIVHSVVISGGTKNVTIDGNNKSYDGLRISTDSLFNSIDTVKLYNLLVQNAVSAVRVSVGSGAPIDYIELNLFYVDNSKNGIYTGLTNQSGTNGLAYDNVSIHVQDCYFTNLEDYGLYARVDESGKKARVTIDDSYIQGAGDEDNEAAIALINNVSFKGTSTQLHENYWGAYFWTTASGANQFDTIINMKIDTSYYHGLIFKRENGSMTVYMEGDTVCDNGALGAGDGGILISAFQGDVDNNMVMGIYSSKIFDSGYDAQEYGIIITDWTGTGDSLKDLKIGDVNKGNKIYGNTSNGIHIITDRAKGARILYNYIHDNGGNGIYIKYADSVLIEKDTIKNHTASGMYGVYIDGSTTKSGADYNKITQCSFEGNNYGIGLANGANEGILNPIVDSAHLDTNLDKLFVWGHQGPPNGYVEVYVATNDPGDNGKTYLGAATPDADGNWSITVDNASSYGITSGTPITALGINQNGSTSQFAPKQGATGVAEDHRPDNSKFNVGVVVRDGATPTIELQLPTPSNITVKVFDVSGRLERRMKKSLSSGTHRIEVKDLRSGVHFIEIYRDGRLVKKVKAITISH